MKNKKANQAVASNLQWINLVLIILTLGAVFFVVPGMIDSVNVPTAAEIADLISVNTPIVDVPTAAEIAALVVIPEVDRRSSLSGDTVQDILEGVYPFVVGQLETDCTNNLLEEFGDDVKDEVQDLIEADLDEDVTIGGVNLNYDNDYRFNVINLGLDDEEDREAEVTSTLRVEYTTDFGDGDSQFVKIYSEASCSDWDMDEDEFDDLEVSYELA